jgi:hypothetical protein
VPVLLSRDYIPLAIGFVSLTIENFMAKLVAQPMRFQSGLNRMSERNSGKKAIRLHHKI